MNYVRYITLTSLIALSIAVGGAFAADTDEGVAADKPQATATINWHASYEEGLKLAKSQNKKALVYFFSTRCFYCSMMEKNTFTNAATIDFLNDNFVPIRLNTESNAELAKKYNVVGVPASIFLEANGTLIGARPGYMPPEDYMKMLEFVSAESYKEK